MPLISILTPLLFGLSFLSGMLGFGVAFMTINLAINRGDPEELPHVA